MWRLALLPLLVFVPLACSPDDGGSDDGDPTVIPPEMNDPNNPDPMLDPDPMTDPDPMMNADAAVPEPDAMVEPEPEGLAVLGNFQHTIENVEVSTLGSSLFQGLSIPMDLEFNPEAPTQLWVVNKGDSSMTIFADVFGDEPIARKRNAPGNLHFLAKPSSLAFGLPNVLATVHEEDQATQPSTPADFMGPTLWTANPNIFDGGHGGHIDMLHNSPNAMGIAWEIGNAFWVFDGAHSALTRYNFNMDHGPGGTDHSDGRTHRYVQGEVQRKPGVVSHMFVHGDLLYVPDTGHNRIATLDINSGTMGPTVGPNYDYRVADQQRMMMDADLLTFLEGSDIERMSAPAGLEIVDDIIYITDNDTSTIFAFDMTGELLDWLDVSEVVQPNGLQGMAISEHGDIYIADSVGQTILKIAPLAD